MWIKSEDGRLYNLEHFDTVEMLTTKEGFQVIARALGTDRVIQLTEVKDNDVEPRAVVKRISNSIVDNDRILDLERSYSTVKKHRFQERTAR